MKKHRFLVSNILVEGDLTSSDSALRHQLRDVLKIAVDETVILVDGTGHEGEAIVSAYPSHGVIFTITKVSERPETWSRVTVCLAVLKNDSFDWATEKLTEVGVATIVPIITERTVKKNLNEKRLAIIAKEAAEQSGRTMAPNILPIIDFQKAVRDPGAVKVFLDMSETKISRADFSESNSTVGGPQTITIFVGPEGGWTDAERSLAIESGCLVRSLGSTVLRAETAAVIGAYAAINL